MGVQQLAQAEGSVEDRLLESSRMTISEIKNMLRLIPITYEFYSLAFRNKTVQKSLRKYFQNYIDALTPVIERGLARGEFRRVDARETAITLAAIVEGSLLRWVFDPKMMQLDEQLNRRSAGSGRVEGRRKIESVIRCSRFRTQGKKDVEKTAKRESRGQGCLRCGSISTTASLAACAGA